MAMHWVATDFGGFDVFDFAEVDVPDPGPGEVVIDVRAAGVNPADYKHVRFGTDRSILPIAIGYELAGVIAALGPDTEIASGGGAVGDQVVVFRAGGAYATRYLAKARNVFAKPATVSFEVGATLLLAGSTAAEALDVTGVTAGDTVLVHGASGSVGVSVLQQAALIGARTIGTASEGNFDTVRRFGGEPVAYGEGLEQRVRDLAPGGVDVAIDTAGTPDALDSSLALVENRRRIVTIAAQGRADELGILMIGGAMPASAAFRDAVRPRLIELAATGRLEVPIARSFPIADAIAAFEFVQEGHPGGKVVLLP